MRFFFPSHNYYSVPAHGLRVACFYKEPPLIVIRRTVVFYSTRGEMAAECAIIGMKTHKIAGRRKIARCADRKEAHLPILIVRSRSRKPSRSPSLSPRRPELTLTERRGAAQWAGPGNVYHATTGVFISAW